LNKKTNPRIPIAILNPFFLKKLIIGPPIVPPIHVKKILITFLFPSLFEIKESLFSAEFLQNLGF